jgi:hypothetical protein
MEQLREFASMTDPDYKAFAQLVADMRAAQKAYFATRDRDVLSRSKALERQVDKFLDDLKAPGLF